MLFNSAIFLYGFLPGALLAFFVAHQRYSVRAAQWVLLVASCVFYGAWDWRYLVMLLLLLSINFHLGGLLARRPSVAWLSGGIALNLLVFGYFKYADFFIGNLNAVAGTQYPLLRVILPLGISFFIFQKIAYLVDCHTGLVADRDPLRFAIFVMFFPQLIAGPIVHHAQIIPQLQKDRLLPDARRVSAGLFFLAVGLFKKVVIADWLGEYVNEPFAHVAELQILDAWTAALAYSLQLYFDFSAYSEMAMGLALLFGIVLPVNFNSPYKAASIAEFWRRWHITLGRFLRDYLYIPLGGNKHGQSRAVLAALTVMVLGGLWHGAGWTFVVWGAMHGVYLAAHRVWKWSGRFTLPQPLGMAITFLVVLFAWVMFRAASVADAITIWKTMLGMNGVMLPSTYLAWLDGSGLKFQQSSFINGIEVWGMACLLAFAMYAKNTHEALAIFTSTAPSRRSAFYLSAMIVVCVLALGRPTTFLYFQF
jgi:D-alanyl-lipoteichoic acid acyltransferase DltB (MBOAT superfamily)